MTSSIPHFVRLVRVLLVLAALAEPVAGATPRSTQPRFDAVFAAGDHLILVDSTHHKSYDLRRPEIVNSDSAAITTCGKKIAFSAYNKNTGWKSIYVAEAPDFSPRLVGAPTGWQDNPHFSPDGTRSSFRTAVKKPNQIDHLQL